MLIDALAYAPTNSRLLARAKQAALSNGFTPRGTIRCLEQAVFRTKAARDAACLLDVDETVISWTCLPHIFARNRRNHIPDFAVERRSGTIVVDVIPLVGPPPPNWVADAAAKRGYGYEAMAQASFNENVRLINARELLRYANYDVTLGDRIRLLAFLNEHGPAPLATCMSVLRHTRDPVGSVASLTLRRFLEMDIDETMLGPDTIVSRFQG